MGLQLVVDNPPQQKEALSKEEVDVQFWAGVDIRYLLAVNGVTDPMTALHVLHEQFERFNPPRDISFGPA